jgi:PAS domain-containing protein
MSQVPTSARPVLSGPSFLKVQDIPETDVLKHALSLAATLLGAEHAVILYDDRTEQVIAGARVNTAPLLEWVVQKGPAAFVADTERANQNGLAGTWRQMGARSAAAAPIYTDCVHIGYLCIYSSHPRPELSSAERQSLDDAAHVVGALVDMRMLASDARHSQMQTRESEQRFRAMADRAPLEDWIAFVHPDDRGRFRETWERAAAGGLPFGLEFRVSNPDGERWVLGQGVNGYIGCCTDVTKHHEREEEHQGECNGISPVLESSSRVLVVTGPDGVIERYNATAAWVLGLSPEHSVGVRLAELCMGFSEAFEATFSDVCQARKEATLRACLATPGDQPHWYEWSLRPMLGPDGTLRRVMCAGRDLSSTAEAATG